MKNLKKIAIFLIAITMIFVYQPKIFAKSRTAEKTIQKTLYVLPSVSDINISGTYRGNGHDRQNLGIYMNQGASFEIRQTNLKKLYNS